MLARTKFTTSGPARRRMASALDGATRATPAWIASLVIIWYASSSAAVLVLKALFAGRLGAPSFAFPLIITATSNIVSASLAVLVRPPRLDVGANAQAQRRYAMLIGAATAGEIGLSNWALKLLTVTLATMLKGTAPLLVFLWGIALGVYAPDVRRLTAAIAVCVGLGLAVAGQRDTQESPGALRIGVVAQCLSGSLSGFRWVITQLFVKGDTGIQRRRPAVLEAILRGAPSVPLSAVDVISSTAPWTAAAVAPFAIMLEGAHFLQWYKQCGMTDFGIVVVSVTCIGCCVFALLWSEYALVKCTSSLTVSIGFVAKEVIMIGAGMFLFGDKLTVASGFGFCLAQAGILGYVVQKQSPQASELPQ